MMVPFAITTVVVPGLRGGTVCSECAQTQGWQKRSSWQKPALASRENNLTFSSQPLTVCGDAGRGALLT